MAGIAHKEVASKHLGHCLDVLMQDVLDQRAQQGRDSGPLTLHMAAGDKAIDLTLLDFMKSSQVLRVAFGGVMLRVQRDIEQQSAAEDDAAIVRYTSSYSIISSKGEDLDPLTLPSKTLAAITNNVHSITACLSPDEESERKNLREIMALREQFSL